LRSHGVVDLSISKILIFSVLFLLFTGIDVIEEEVSDEQDDEQEDDDRVTGEEEDEVEEEDDEDDEEEDDEDVDGSIKLKRLALFLFLIFKIVIIGSLNLK